MRYCTYLAKTSSERNERHTLQQATSQSHKRCTGVKQSIGYIALVVREYAEAIAFYVQRLGFTLVEDTFIEAQNERWVLLAPPGSTESHLRK